MRPCDHERQTVEAVRADRLTPEIEAHLAACPVCREVADTARLMTTLAAETARLADRRRMPAAAQLWWKGQLARRWEAEARAVAPLDRMQRVEILAGVVAAIILLVSFFRTLRPDAAGAAGSDFWPALAGLASSSALTWVAAGAFGAAVASIVMFRRLLHD
jgi:hypothetical protein